MFAKKLLASLLRLLVINVLVLFCGSTWTRTKIDGLTVRSNRPLYDRPVCLLLRTYIRKRIKCKRYINNIEIYLKISKTISKTFQKYFQGTF